MKKDLCISIRSRRAKIISDNLVTCFCDVVKRTGCKWLERFQRLYDPRIKMSELCCMISCTCIIYLHDGCKIIDIWGAGKKGYCPKAVIDGQILMKVIGSLTWLSCVMKIGFGSSTPTLSSNLSIRTERAGGPWCKELREMYVKKVWINRDSCYAKL